MSSNAGKNDVSEIDPAGDLIALLQSLARLARVEDSDRFPRFDPYVELQWGGWGGPGTCAMCGAGSERLTTDGPYCMPCIKLQYGVELGEFLGLMRLIRSLAEPFQPVCVNRRACIESGDPPSEGKVRVKARGVSDQRG